MPNLRYTYVLNIYIICKLIVDNILNEPYLYLANR